MSWSRCPTCRVEFTGTRDFDSHRYGPYDGRRFCLIVRELELKGWFQDRYGRWSHPRRRAASARQGFAGKAAAA
jgi:hypothetical protein